MACVTLKRPLEWIDPSMSAEQGAGTSSGSSSPTSMIISNSPPHSMRSPKRLCLGVGASSSPSTGSPGLATNSSSSYFKPVNSSDIAGQIREEMIRLRFIRNRVSALSSSVNSSATQTTASSSSTTEKKSTDDQHQEVHKEASMGSPRAEEAPTTSSTTATASTSTSSSTSNTSPYSLYARLAAAVAAKQCDKPTPSTSTPTTDPTPKRPRTSSSSSLSSTNKPLFTFNQVVAIVEKLLREKEETIRREYEQALTARLAEQYDQFVKFSYDQIQRRFDSQALPSYLS